MEECGDKYMAGDTAAGQLIADSTPKLMSDYRRMKEIFAPVFPEEEKKAADTAEDDSNKEPISDDALNELLSALKEFASILDYEDMSELITQARDYRLPDEEKKRFDALEQAIRLVDTEKILELLK